MISPATRALLIGGLLVARQATAIELRIVQPVAGQPVFGRVEFEVAPLPSEARAAKVELYVDGRLAGVVDRPPWRLIVDVGEAAAEHRFAAVWYDADGPRASASLRTPTVHSDETITVALRQVFVRVERNGSATRDLERQDFELTVDGQPQPILAFEHGDVPFAAVLLLDASTSMGHDMATAVAGARGFLGAVSTLDEAKLLLFSSRLVFETPFTDIPAILTLGLSGVRPQGGTALNDALAVAVARLAEQRRRRVLILLSDGVDVESILPMASVRREVAAAGALLYWLRLPGEGGEAGAPARYSSAWRDAGAHEREIAELERTVRESDGRIVPLVKVDEAPAALARIARELREQYMLAYAPPAVAGPARPKVKVRRPGLEARVEGQYAGD